MLKGPDMRKNNHRKAKGNPFPSLIRKISDKKVAAITKSHFLQEG
jgi:hypothetical protein